MKTKGKGDFISKVIDIVNKCNEITDNTDEISAIIVISSIRDRKTGISTVSFSCAGDTDEGGNGLDTIFEQIKKKLPNYPDDLSTSPDKPMYN